MLRVGAGQGAGGLLRPMWLLGDAGQGTSAEKDPMNASDAPIKIARVITVPMGVMGAVV